ncbi:peroxidase 25 [Populus alba]|uniref:peroxidase n=1 Tax=Populus alba TaxID=43335 RepID=A0A4U5QJL9_POPAL|nr:peroxidase 25-like [Populus alba]TKS10381.1 hypothetical protein D5086_0000084390 [Populus alba]
MEGLWLVVLVIFAMALSVESQLKTGFYSSSCPKAEAIVRSTVESYFKKDPTIAAGLLRLHFHDCFVQGCDGSVLIAGLYSAERNALPNLGLRNGEEQKIEEIYLHLPHTSIRKLVSVSGGHTLGRTHCQFIRYRLYNFTATGNADPTINQSFLSQLRALCPNNGDGTIPVPLDKDSQTDFDTSFFKNVRDGNGVLESDQRLWDDAATRHVVKKYAGNIRGLLGLRFDVEFRQAMVKMSSIDVKTGTNGEIRKACSKFN